MTKVLLISENPPSIYGGIERHCYNIKLLFKDDNNIIIEALSKEQINFQHIKIANKIVFSQKELTKAIIESKCDIVHIHGFASFVVCQAIHAAHKAGKKIIYTAHFHPFKRLDKPLFGFLFFHILLKPLLPKIHTIICINKEDTAFFKQYHNNVVTIPNWLNTKATTIPTKKQSNIILFVGRNDKNKSPQYLYDVPPKYEIHCVTNSNKNLSKDFIYHYKISDQELNELYRNSALLVVPSRYEAFSYVVLEALNQGTPVLISNNVRIADYIANIQGVTIFQYGNHTDFQQKISIACNQTVDIARIQEIFSPSRIKQTLYNIYTS